MRVFVTSLITAGSFMMLSADTRGIELPSAEWCSAGTLVPVAEFHLLPSAFKGLRPEGKPTHERDGLDFKMVGQFDDDYPTDPREEEEEAIRTANAMASVHCSQFTLAASDKRDAGEVIAVAEWPQALIKADAGTYSLSQGIAGVCLRCE